jgi:hypothetical protein
VARRLWGLALALVITGAPLAPVVCGVMCASHHAPSMASNNEHHSCHESSTAGPIAVPVPHTCGHDSDGSIAPQELIQILVSVGLTETPVIALGSFDLSMDSVPSMPIDHSPPGLSALTTPLRV